MSQKPSAGLIMYRRKNGKAEVFLVHPGGPFWAKKDEGVWSIPKGEMEEGEDSVDAAKREFGEETGFPVGENIFDLGSTKRKDGKVVHAFAFEGDADPSKMTCNTVLIDWPPRSGKKLEIPECDKGDFFDIHTAKTKVVGYQLPLIEAFEQFISQQA